MKKDVIIKNKKLIVTTTEEIEISDDKTIDVKKALQAELHAIIKDVMAKKKRAEEIQNLLKQLNGK